MQRFPWWTKYWLTLAFCLTSSCQGLGQTSHPKNLATLLNPYLIRSEQDRLLPMWRAFYLPIDRLCNCRGELPQNYVQIHFMPSEKAMDLDTRRSAPPTMIRVGTKQEETNKRLYVSSVPRIGNRLLERQRTQTFHTRLRWKRSQTEPTKRDKKTPWLKRAKGCRLTVEVWTFLNNVWICWMWERCLWAFDWRRRRSVSSGVCKIISRCSVSCGTTVIGIQE